MYDKVNILAAQLFYFYQSWVSKPWELSATVI